MSVDIRLARPDDRNDLIELQRRASLMWEDTRQRLMDEPELIDLDPEMIARNEVFVAEEDGEVLGFAAIVAHEGNDAELEGIFVEPAAWRRGIGTLLLRQIEREAHAWQASRLHVIANRHVADFYTANGFTIVGETRTELGPVALLMVKPVPMP